MDWLRLLSPSWRFFDQLGTVSHLMYRTNLASHSWKPFFDKPGRSLLNLFYNPLGNLYLYQVSLVDQFVQEASLVTHDEEIKKLKTYNDLVQLVRTRVNQIDPLLKQFEFKIQLKSQDKLIFEDYLMSGLLDV